MHEERRGRREVEEGGEEREERKGDAVDHLLLHNDHTDKT